VGRETRPDERRLRKLLRATATDLGTKGRDNWFGHGLVNRAAALCTRGASLSIRIVCAS